MAWTRDTLVTEFRRLVDQPNTAIISAVNAAGMVNKAYRELLGKISQRNPFYFINSASLATVAGTHFATLPADCIMPYRLLDSDGTELQFLDMTMLGPENDSGEPEYWDRNGNKILFSPKPDAIYTYTLWYHYQPSDMSAGSSAPEFVPGFEDLIAILAAIHSKMVRDEKADFIQLYPDRLQTMLAAANTKQTQSSRRVQRSTYQDADL
jgi:hypothetical protein